MKYTIDIDVQGILNELDTEAAKTDSRFSVT